MPSVDVAMARSLRGGIWGSLGQGLNAAIGRRDALADVQTRAGEAINAFSSWDNCMQETYCKWPVIAIIIVGGLIIFSVVWCIIRCACCGLSCCCQCCYCLKCCGQCCGLCDPPKGRRHKYLDNETVPSTQGYRTEPAMKLPIASPTAPIPARSEPPQYAQYPQHSQFDTSRQGGEDSLPAMPTLDNTIEKKARVEEDDAVEMDQLKKPDVRPSPATATIGGATALAPASSHTSPAVSPGPRGVSPYGQPPPVGSNGYMGQGAQRLGADLYAAGGQGYNYDDGYSPLSPSPGVNQYGAAATRGMGRQPPHQQQGHDNGYTQVQADGGYGQGPRSPHAYGRGYDQPSQGHQGYQDHQNQGYQGQQPGYRGPPPQGGYGQRRPSPPRSNTYDAQQQMQRSPGPQQGGYTPQQGYGQNGGQNGGHSRPYPPQQQPQHQYSADPRGPGPRPGPRPVPNGQYSHPGVMPPPQLHNNSGFDFNSGFSRPQELDSGTGPGPSAPDQQANNGNGGYQSYQPY